MFSDIPHSVDDLPNPATSFLIRALDVNSVNDDCEGLLAVAVHHQGANNPSLQTGYWPQ